MRNSLTRGLFAAALVLGLSYLALRPAGPAQEPAAPGSEVAPSPASVGAAPALPAAHAHPAATGLVATAPRDASHGQAHARSPAPAAPLPPDFIDTIVDPTHSRVAFTLPDGNAVAGTIDLKQHDAAGLLFVQGRVTEPRSGSFFFQRQTVDGVAGPLVGHVRFDGRREAWRIEPAGVGGAPVLTRVTEDEIVCVSLPQPEAAAQLDPAQPIDPEQLPQTFPTNIAIPAYQNGVIPLESLPGATAVIYIDLDGEKGPFSGWGSFDAAAYTLTPAQVKDIWQRVAEDYAPFNINVTTDLKVFQNAPQGRRQHVIVTPTVTAAPSAGGVAYIGSFNWSGDTVCWGFYTGKAGAEVISHEVGHTLGLGHDGRISPSEGYYGGHGSGATGWAPIMGVGYYKELVQWSKGEYTSANNTQDDLAIIANNNNDVDVRASDAGDTHATAALLEVYADGAVTNEGIIESRADVDAFRFTMTNAGAAVFHVRPVTVSPNLDLLAELYDSNSVLIATNNPDLALNASLSNNLAAGTYTLRVSGVGRGDPLVDGYTDYDSLGGYTITGRVQNALSPDRFTVAENSANGTAVGTVATHVDHAGAALTFSLSAGNTSNALAIDASTGALTVNNAAALDFESLSTAWDDPAWLNLTVDVVDSADAARNESLRVVVAVTDVNEAPVTSNATISVLEHTRANTALLTVYADDPDHQDFPTFSIVGGNTGGAFSIVPSTGLLSVTGELNYATQSSYTLSIEARDQATPSLATTSTVTVTVVDTVEGFVPGAIVRTYFENLSGTAVSALTGSTNFPDRPGSEEFLSAFDGGSHGDNFGSTIRGFVIPPTTGSYTFWIASDDDSALLFSTSTNPASAVQIARVSGYTAQYEWTKYSTQQAVAVTLQAGQAYYIEARHKEGSGGDHVAVAWQGPGISRQVIPGLFLAPYYQNYAPRITPTTMSIREDAAAGALLGTVAVTDVNTQDLRSAFAIVGGTGAGLFGIDAASGAIRLTNAGVLNAAATPTYTLTVRASDNGTPALGGTGVVSVTVLSSGALSFTGLHQQVWDDLGGSTLATLTGSPLYPKSPARLRLLTSFDSGQNIADNYGSRIQGYVVPPVSGAYTFYLASDDDSRLLLGTGSSAASAVQIASISGFSSYGEWTKYGSQVSAAKTLTAGQRYYIETLQKEGGGGDHVQVAWTGPGITSITVIAGAYLQPYDINQPPVWTNAPYSFSVTGTAPAGTLVGTLLARDPFSDPVTYSVVGGSAPAGFAVNPTSGALTVASSLVSYQAQTVTVIVAAQDAGMGGSYPLKSSNTTVTIAVGPVPLPPAFTSDPLVKADASDVAAYSATLADSATDPNAGDTLTFSKIAGPAWLSVAANGVLSGSPAIGDVGLNTFTVRVTDAAAHYDDAVLRITVIHGFSQPTPFLRLPGHQTVTVNQPLTFNVTASNISLSAPTLQAAGLPSGANFSPTPNGKANVGTFSWMPTQVGTYPVQFLAFNPDSMTNRQTLLIYVGASGEPVNGAGVPLSQTNWTVNISDLLAGSSGNATVVWPTVSGLVYDLYATPDMLGAGGTQWSLVGGMLATGTHVSTAVTADGARRYFQVVLHGARPDTNGAWAVMRPSIAPGFKLFGSPVLGDRALSGDFGASLASDLAGHNGGVGNGVGSELHLLQPGGSWQSFYLDASGLWRDSVGTPATNVLEPGQGVMLLNYATTAAPVFAGPVGNRGTTTNTVNEGWNIVAPSEGRALSMTTVFQDLAQGAPAADYDEASADMIAMYDAQTGGWIRLQRLPDGSWLDLRTFRTATLQVLPGEAFYYFRQPAGAMKVRF